MPPRTRKSTGDVNKNLKKVVDENLPQELRSIAKMLADSVNTCMQIAAKDFYFNLSNQLSDQIFQKSPEFLLPEGIKYYESSNSVHVIVLESKPTTRTITIELDGDIRRKRLAFPYVVSFLCLEKTKKELVLKTAGVFYRTKPISSFDDLLFHPNLPNIHWCDFNENSETIRTHGDCNPGNWHQLMLCMGANKSFTSILNSNALCKTAKDFLTDFWCSPFNTDLPRSFDYYNAKFGLNFDTWEKQTIENPLFMLEKDWVPAIRISDLCGEAMSYFNNDLKKSNETINDFANKIYKKAFRKFEIDSKEQIDVFVNITSEDKKRSLELFVDELSKGVSVIGNDKIRGHVISCFANSLKKAWK